MRRKIGKLTLLAAVIAAAAIALSACAGLQSGIATELPDSYEGMRATDKSAFDLYKSAYAAFIEAEGFKRTQYYDFNSNLFQMKIKTTRKKDGDALYNEEVVVGTGFMKLNEGKRFYFDGTNASSIYFNDKAKVPAEGEGDALYTVLDWADYVPYDKGSEELAAELQNYRSRLVSYYLTEREALSADSVDTVYERGGAYYFTLTVDCSAEAMKGRQAHVATEIAEKTGGNTEDLKMLQNTTVQAAVEIVDGVPRFLMIKTVERYEGKISIFSAKCDQIYYHIFDYTEGAQRITADDRLNIA